MIDYLETTTSDDETLQNFFEKIASEPDLVEVSANSIRVVAVALKMPKNEFDSTILSEICVSRIFKVRKNRANTINVGTACIVGVVLVNNGQARTTNLKLKEISGDFCGSKPHFNCRFTESKIK